MVTTTTDVVRDGDVVEIDAHELVAGDVVLLASGTKVPADMRLHVLDPGFGHVPPPRLRQRHSFPFLAEPTRWSRNREAAERVVIDGHYATGAGVSAAIDVAQTVVRVAFPGLRSMS
jgi:hypothetical protein